MARKPAEKSAEAPKSDPRARVVDALMALAARQPWDMISLTAIAEEAEISLADLRDLFPSKGAILGGFVRRIDRIVLDGTGEDMQDQPARERVLDIMMRRFDALLPYRDALRSISRAFERDPLGMLALNQQGLNSWRYMLEAAGIEVDGPMGALKIQGAILVFARAFRIFLDESDPALTRTMAALDREVKRGEWVLARAEGLDRMAAPFRGFFRAACDGRKRRSRRHADEPHPDAA
ncbi:MAG: TetR family transcriptional regulator [Methylobacterium sp.]|nr:MAG: TetR family transcriptional regulator [Methylobacterium sp.]